VAQFAKSLYLGGIQYQLKHERWKRIEQEGAARPFGHYVYYRNGGSMIALLWPSRDGVKPEPRKDYPMIACAEITGLGTRQALSAAIPVLRQMRDTCTATESRQDVLKAVADAREQLNAAIRELTVAQTETPDRTLLQRLINDPEQGLGEQILQVLSAVERRIDVRGQGFGAVDSAAADDVRVPSGSTDPAEALAMWITFVDALTGPKSPAVLILPVDADWLDLFIGVPNESQYFALRAGTSVRPLITQDASPLDETHEDRPRQFLMRLGLGIQPRSDPPSRNESNAPAAPATPIEPPAEPAAPTTAQTAPAHTTTARPSSAASDRPKTGAGAGHDDSITRPPTSPASAIPASTAPSSANPKAPRTRTAAPAVAVAAPDPGAEESEAMSRPAPSIAPVKPAAAQSVSQPEKLLPATSTPPAVQSTPSASVGRTDLLDGYTESPHVVSAEELAKAHEAIDQAFSPVDVHSAHSDTSAAPGPRPSTPAPVSPRTPDPSDLPASASPEIAPRLDETPPNFRAAASTPDVRSASDSASVSDLASESEWTPESPPQRAVELPTPSAPALDAAFESQATSTSATSQTMFDFAAPERELLEPPPPVDTRIEVEPQLRSAVAEPIDSDAPDFDPKPGPALEPSPIDSPAAEEIPSEVPPTPHPDSHEKPDSVMEFQPIGDVLPDPLAFELNARESDPIDVGPVELRAAESVAAVATPIETASAPEPDPFENATSLVPETSGLTGGEVTGQADFNTGEENLLDTDPLAAGAQPLGEAASGPEDTSAAPKAKKKIDSELL
jgi:hypothetical protein